MRIPSLLRRRRPPAPSPAQVVNLDAWNDSSEPGPLTPIRRPDALDPLDHRIVMAQPVRADVLLSVSQLIQELGSKSLDGSRGDIVDNTIETWRRQWHAAIDDAAEKSHRAVALRLSEQQTEDLARATEDLRRLRGELRTLEASARYHRDSLLGLDTTALPATTTPEQAAEALPSLQVAYPELPELTPGVASHPGNPENVVGPGDQDTDRQEPPQQDQVA